MVTSDHNTYLFGLNLAFYAVALWVASFHLPEKEIMWGGPFGQGGKNFQLKTPLTEDIDWFTLISA